MRLVLIFACPLLSLIVMSGCASQASRSSPLLEQSDAADSLARASVEKGDYRAAERYFEEAVDLRLKVVDDDKDSKTVIMKRDLADVYSKQGKLHAAETTYLEVLERLAILESSRWSPYLSATEINLGQIYRRTGKLNKAETALKGALERLRGTLGDEHNYTLTALDHLGHIHLDQGRLEEAEDLLGKSYRVRRATQGEARAETLTTLHLLTGVYFRQERIDEAAELAQMGFDLSLEHLGDDHDLTKALALQITAITAAKRLKDQKV